MYEKNKRNMRTFIISVIFVIMTSSESRNNTSTQIIDKNFFKNELQQSVLEFCEDLNIDPDSVYVPFRDTL